MLDFLKELGVSHRWSLGMAEGGGERQRRILGGKEHMREWRGISHHQQSLKGETWLRVLTGNWLTFDKVRKGH